ncbi:MAG TPA: hypothetical protein PKW92_10920 [Smithella sp.]|jgi:hypothetical protein|nr:hypothetical protein [Smithella sp.]HQC19812.1 hypothetical protein [Smithella sp.]
MEDSPRQASENLPSLGKNSDFHVDCFFMPQRPANFPSAGFKFGIGSKMFHGSPVKEREEKGANVI